MSPIHLQLREQTRGGTPHDGDAQPPASPAEAPLSEDSARNAATRAIGFAWKIRPYRRRQFPVLLTAVTANHLSCSARMQRPGRNARVLPYCSGSQHWHKMQSRGRESKAGSCDWGRRSMPRAPGHRTSAGARSNGPHFAGLRRCVSPASRARRINGRHYMAGYQRGFDRDSSSLCSDCRCRIERSVAFYSMTNGA